ncbi:hypothetical protein Esti_006700 [Eimeria stiedai]
MLQRRCKLLEPLAAELNPQYYLDLVRQVCFELGDAFEKLHLCKWKGQLPSWDDDSATIVEEDAEQMQEQEYNRLRKCQQLHGYAARSAHYFTIFIKSFELRGADPISALSRELRAALVSAKMKRALMMSRMGRSKDECIACMVAALKEYEALGELFASFEESAVPGSLLNVQKTLCEETCGLLRLRINKLCDLGSRSSFLQRQRVEGLRVWGRAPR